MSETEDGRRVPEARDDRPPTDEIPSNVPDPDAPLKGVDVPDDWLDQRQTTPSGRPGACG
jgi:hypothetical protein